MSITESPSKTAPVWVSSEVMAELNGHHVVTLRNLRRLKNGPFKQGRDYRFSGAGRGRLQWHRINAEASFTKWQRPVEVELFRRDVVAVQR